MSNILILNGAPRKNGSTASLVKAFTEVYFGPPRSVNC